MASVQHTGRSRLTRTSAFFFRHPRLKLIFALLPPVAWMVVIYLASLSVLLATAFWSQDELSGKIIHSFTLDNFKQIWQDPVNRTIIMRTLLTALAVTAIDIVLAFPLAYYMARVASRHLRALLIIGILMPLWSSYLIKVYTWRLITAQDGALNWALGKVGLGPIHIAYTQTAVVIVFVYLWLPYMVLPIYAALERIPNSVLEASGDLGARAWPTFRRVVLPLALPGVAAGSIFTFSLTLGDYIVPDLIGGGRQFIGNVIFFYQGLANDLPFAAAMTFVPIGIIIVYLLLVKRLGAFEAL
jgi:putative spermidine/putrescine transport system permease protein